MRAATIKPTVRLQGLSLLPILALAGCGNRPSCSSDRANLTRDPGSDLYAVTEVRNCGATSDYATIIRVGRAPEPDEDAIEIFVGDTDHGAAAEQGDALWTSVVWTAPRHLSVAYAVHARSFKQIASAKGASITFRADDVLRLPPVP
jgi:hypothetical protein